MKSNNRAEKQYMNSLLETLLLHPAATQWEPLASPTIGQNRATH